MIDIHFHLLPGVDDGPETLDMTMDMIAMAIADGTTHIVATPHANNMFHYDRAAHESLLQSIRECMTPGQRSQLTLGLGSDFHLTYDNVEVAKADPAHFSINGKGYLMVELPDHAIPRNTVDALYELRISKSIPVLTHPERNKTIQQNLDMMKPWMVGGLLLQVTAGSLTGVFGKIAERAAFDLLDRNWVHFIASDAHSTGRRNPKLSDAFEIVAKRYGQETATRIFHDNPLAAFEGRSLGPQPDPKGLHEDLSSKGFFARLFGR